MEAIRYDAEKAYEKAWETAMRESRRARAARRDPHPPSLDMIEKTDGHGDDRPLGTREIPLDLIAGTLSRSRANAFSPGFLPLLDRDTEFADKWIAVYCHQLHDGITDPIAVIEHMGLYYVVEGNKRVSVMKHLGGESIRASVIRRVPAFNPADLSVRRYHAQLDFEAATGLQDVRISSESGYERLRALIRAGGDPEGVEAVLAKRFSMGFRAPFLRLLRSMPGAGSLPSPDDVLLTYLTLFEPWSETWAEQTVARRLEKLLADWRNEPETDRQVRTPATLPIHTRRPFLRSAETRRIGILHLADAPGSQWTRAHQAGLAAAAEHLPAGTLHAVILPAGTTDLGNTLGSAPFADIGSIVCTAPSLQDAVRKASIEDTRRVFHLCAPLPPTSRIGTYYGRPHEALFLMGMLAATRTGTGRIGWLGGMPEQGGFAALNAFALGLRSLHPGAEIVVAHNGGDLEADWLRLHGAGADLVLSAPSDGGARSEEMTLAPFALLCPADGSPCRMEDSLASVFWDWGTFYAGFLPYLLGAGKSRSRHAMPTWRGGLATALPDLRWRAEAFPSETARLVAHMRQAIMTDAFRPFTGPIRDDRGDLRVQPGHPLSDRDILEMDWAVDGIRLLD